MLYVLLTDGGHPSHIPSYTLHPQQTHPHQLMPYMHPPMSRAQIFRVSYVGFTLGPALGTFLIRHPFAHIQTFGQQHREIHSVAAAFWAVRLFGVVNLIPSFRMKQSGEQTKRPMPPCHSVSSTKPLPPTAFTPRKTMVNGRMREDWSML